MKWQLRKNKNYCDVTLATDDGYQIQAHKVVLSAGSEFFSNIFMKTIHPSSFLYLKGFKGVDLEYVVDFLYNGEALITQEELENFLDTAHELQLKGLQSSIQNIFDSFEKLEKQMNTNGEEESVLNSNVELELQIDQMMEKKNGHWLCKVCGKTTKRKSHIKEHAEIHVDGVAYRCHICNKILLTRKTLREHISNFHSGLFFDCNICGKSDMTKHSYGQHIQNHTGDVQ